MRKKIRLTKPLARAELLRYKALQKSALKKFKHKPLLFWKQNHRQFPWCALLARRDLAVFAGQATIERIFSKAGRHATKARAKMLPRTLQRLVFLNLNKERILAL